jgi:hypothetical protein
MTLRPRAESSVLDFYTGLLELVGTPVPIGNRSAPQRPAQSDDQGMRLLDKIALVSHLDVIGVHWNKISRILRGFGRCVEQRDWDWCLVASYIEIAR